ncbi:MAG: MFS transporter [Planctomycetia bacterium]|nr:MFS transporter [Planctomycetia bacterium]
MRRAIFFSYVAAMIWSIGNALTSGMLIVFLAQELGAGGKQLSYLQAAPALLGLLRLFTPVAIPALGGTKRTCLLLSTVAYLLLFAVPAIVSVGRHEIDRSAALAALIGLLCVHQLLEQVATVALWTWLADLIPRRIRGRYFARRNMLQLAVIIPTLLLSGELADRATTADRSQTATLYGALVACGAVVLLISLLPLLAMPAARPKQLAPTAAHLPRFAFRALFASLYDPASRRLLFYGCWFSFFNGLFAIAQNILPKGVLGLGLAPMNRMQTVMRLGQIGISAWAGPWSDRHGNRPVLVLCQLAVGAAPLFYFIASPAQPYWLYGAWLLWSAYAGINICLPNLTMRLAGPEQRAAHLSAYHALTSLFLVVGTLAGGYLFDRLGRETFSLFGWSLDKFHLFFLAAFIMRSAGAAIVATVPEPGADAWSKLIARRETPDASR